MSLDVAGFLTGLGIRYRGGGSFKTTCPKCSHKRKNKTEHCLSVIIDSSGVGLNCHNCGYTDGEYSDAKRASQGIFGGQKNQSGSGDRYGALQREARARWACSR